MESSKKEKIEALYNRINKISSLYHSMVMKTGVSDNEFWIWYTLIAIGGEHTQQSICAAWSLSKQTVNTIVSAMVKKGYATLEKAPDNRSRKIIRLTDTGLAHGRKIIGPLASIEENAFDMLSNEELDTCIFIFSRFVEACQKIIK